MALKAAIQFLKHWPAGFLDALYKLAASDDNRLFKFMENAVHLAAQISLSLLQSMSSAHWTRQQIGILAVKNSKMDQRDNSTQLQLLLHRVLSEEAGAFDEFTMAATERLRSLARSMLRKYPHVKRWEDTDDVFQAVMIRLHQSIHEVRPESTREFFGLAATQIRRSLIDLARHYYGVYGIGTKHHSRGGGKAADDSGGALLNTGTDDRPDSLEAWTGFHEAIDMLPSDTKEVFSLVWYGGLMQKDVATLLGVAEKTVMRRMTRARIRLHEILADQRPDMD